MAENDIRAEYKPSDLGEGVRGKYYERYRKGRNLRDSMQSGSPLSRTRRPRAGGKMP